MDDFFDKAKTAVKNTIGNVREFYADNKHIIGPMIHSLVNRIHPALGSLYGAAT